MADEAKRAWVFGDNVNTDQLAPGLYIKLPIEEIAKHCLEGLSPDFVSSVAPGDIVVAGKHFGMGSSREQAAEALVCLGVRVVIAHSFGGIFYRNAVNFGLVPLVCDDAHRISDKDRLSIDVKTGEITNHTKSETYQADPMPDHLIQIIDAGGLMSYLKARFENKQKRTSKNS